MEIKFPRNWICSQFKWKARLNFSIDVVDDDTKKMYTLAPSQKQKDDLLGFMKIGRSQLMTRN